MTGLTIKNTENKVILDMNSVISQNVGSVVTGGNNGSTQIPLPPAGKTSYFIVTPLVDMNRSKGKLPGVILQGSTLSWEYSYATNGWGFFSANCEIFYGYY